MHFFTLPEDPVMAKKIKPQRAQACQAKFILGKAHNIAYTFLIQNFSSNLFTFSPILYA